MGEIMVLHELTSGEKRDQMELAEDWFREDSPSGIDRQRPGIYLWQIEDVGIYVGHAARLDAVALRYATNILDKLNGRPYHNKPRNFRRVHDELAKAVLERRKIVLTLLENVASKSDRQIRKKELIAQRREVLERQGLSILNGLH
jgi:hypothetical protein